MSFLKRLVLLGSALLLAVACGGGGGGGGGATGSSSRLSGVAATGAPIIGYVTVKDADGAVKTVPIEADGTYSVNVSNMTAPFKLRAQGHVGSIDVDLYSAALAADVNGTINITPFTNLIISQVAGEIASNYFANADTSLLTDAALAAEETRVRTALTDVLLAAGLTDSFDLLRASFTPDNTGFDKVMDVIKVTVDPETGAAQIKNIIDESAISYNVATPATTSGTVNAPSETALSDFDLIKQDAVTFFGLFASHIPTYDALVVANIFDVVHFKQSGLNLNEWYSADLAESGIIGIQLSGIRLISLTDTEALAEIGIALNGQDHLMTWYFAKQGNVWKILGNQRIASVSISSHAEKYIYHGTSGFGTGLTIDIANPKNEAAYAIVRGPGLPEGGVRCTNNLDGDLFSVGENASDFYSMEDVDIASAFADVSSNIEYEFALYDSGDQLLNTYTATLRNAPLPKSELIPNSALYFAAITPATEADLLTLVAPVLVGNGTVYNKHFSWTVPTGMHNSEVWVRLAGSVETAKFVREMPSGTSVTLPLQATFPVTQEVNFAVHLRDNIFDREFDTSIYADPTPAPQ